MQSCKRNKTMLVPDWWDLAPVKIALCCGRNHFFLYLTASVWHYALGRYSPGQWWGFFAAAVHCSLVVRQHDALYGRLLWFATEWFTDMIAPHFRTKWNRLPLCIHSKAIQRVSNHGCLCHLKHERKPACVPAVTSLKFSNPPALVCLAVPFFSHRQDEHWWDLCQYKSPFSPVPRWTVPDPQSLPPANSVTIQVSRRCKKSSGNTKSLGVGM